MDFIDILLDFNSRILKTKSLDFYFPKRSFCYTDIVKNHCDIKEIKSLEDCFCVGYSGLALGDFGNVLYLKDGEIFYSDRVKNDVLFQMFFYDNFSVSLAYNPDLYFAVRRANFEYGNNLKGELFQDYKNIKFIFSDKSALRNSVLLKFDSDEKREKLSKNLDALWFPDVIVKKFGDFKIDNKSSVGIEDVTTGKPFFYDVSNMSFAEAVDLMISF